MKALEEYSSINGESLDNSRGPLTLELGMRWSMTARCTAW